MKSIIHLSLLLISLQVRCHHLPGRHDYKDDHEADISPEYQHLLSAEEQGEKSTRYRKIIPSNGDFAFNFYRNIAADATGKNIFFSPLSISTAFSLLALGAKSVTHDEIYRGLAFNLLEMNEKEIHEGFCQLIRVLNQPDNKAQVNTGNALFIEKSLKFLPAFVEDAQALYEANVFPTDFNVSRVAKKQINDYVQNKTHGKIAYALEELDPCTVMVLVNYIFFKAYWENPFDTHLIRERDFFVDANTTVKVNLMHRKGYYKFVHDEDLSSWIVELPYKGDATAFFILPDEGKMAHVESALRKESLSKWTKSFLHETIRLFIPKFSISASYDVKDLLQKMGITAVFNDTADLSRITGELNLKVSKVIHKALLDINESGTEAAAVTTIEFMLRSAPSYPLHTIRFDRPFLIMIVHQETSSILFIAKIVNPKKG
nr:alpha-1-antitrypsin-like [Pogona vitticeps]XP_020670064.1 alpha-1-antitrypsin-like [Pogona vitticeps]XP_020670065.1 alpha-1-antitrypsin-like [Pogona vitticeps]XP_020670066.1 alpha-1-antitrypsin-like [Pogona vitticeps]XP_020670067.1 alpha-1-antitrypsin-like [Pogona vitticeps]XP_020670068.1 alpha-1-antitrypsin-like [Pogona vitticeps]XP_020670069.1 alpha-1-antitrypsin-like [Pogona vitticeps]